MTYTIGSRVLYRVEYLDGTVEWLPATVDYDLQDGTYSVLPDHNPRTWAQRSEEGLKHAA